MPLKCRFKKLVTLKDSVHALLKEQAEALGLSAYFEFTDKGVKCASGAEFIFRGFYPKPESLKSLQGIDICWVEEAQTVSELSWKYLNSDHPDGRAFPVAAAFGDLGFVQPDRRDGPDVRAVREKPAAKLRRGARHVGGQPVVSRSPGP